MAPSTDIIIGIDAGTSVIKAVAFDLSGVQLAVSSVRNTYATKRDGSAIQSMDQTWSDCATAIRGLSDKISGLAERVAAIGVTGQGDGTWLVGACSRDSPNIVEQEDLASDWSARMFEIAPRY